MGPRFRPASQQVSCTTTRPSSGQAHLVDMAPKAEKQPAKKSVSKVGGAKSGRKKGSKKAIESYKIYIYKVRVITARHWGKAEGVNTATQRRAGLLRLAGPAELQVQVLTVLACNSV